MSDPLYVNQAPSDGNQLYGDDTDFDGTAGSWVSNQNATVTQTTAEAHTGVGALSIVATAASNASARHVGGAGTNGIPVTEGETFVAEAWFRAATVGRSCQVGVNWYTAGAALISTTFGTAVADTTSGWKRALFAGVAPATAEFAVVICQVVSPGAGEVHYVDDVEFQAAVAPQYNAAELRRLLGGLLHKGGAAHPFGARAGVLINGSTDADIASLTGTTWTVHDINGDIYPGLTSQSGPYVFAHPSESGSTAAADGTNDRIDALDLPVYDDDEDSSGLRDVGPVEYVIGTPDPSPSPPPLTDNSIRAAEILVPQQGTGSPSLTVVVPYTVALGGILPVRTVAELPTARRYEGMYADQQDLNLLVRWNGAAWVAANTPTPAFAESTTDIAAFTNTTFAAGSPVVGLTFVAPPSGMVHVTVSGLINSATDTVRAELGWELREGGTIGSGTVVMAASVDRALAGSHAVNTSATASIGGSHRFPVLSGLTAGSTYNVRTMHRVQPTAGTGNINYRSLTVEPVM